MKVCYLLQTHKNPDQVFRLIHTIKKLSPTAYIVLNHDFTSCDLDRAKLQNLLDVQVIPSRGGRGSFDLVQSYLDVVEWLLENSIDFDWLIHLTGQDYPIQPLDKIEHFLSETHHDGFMEYFEVFSKESPWKIREGHTRYGYQYRTIIDSLSEWQKEALRPVKILNYVQDFFRVNFSYGFTLGLKTPTPFNSQFICYGGSFLCILSKKCIDYIHQFVQANPAVVQYYKGVANPDESFIQTVLMNSQLFNLCNDCKRYFDFSETRHGHPQILTTNDLPALVQSQAFFARKFDSTKDSKVLDLIDTQLLENISFKKAELALE